MANVELAGRATRLIESGQSASGNYRINDNTSCVSNERVSERFVDLTQVLVAQMSDLGSRQGSFYTNQVRRSPIYSIQHASANFDQIKKQDLLESSL